MFRQRRLCSCFCYEIVEFKLDTVSILVVALRLSHEI
jgi:hypothetical protein